MRRIFSLLLLFLCSNVLFYGLEHKMDGKKAVLVVSFGTSYEETRAKTIGACEKKIAQAFPEFEVRRAFTSNIIRKILRERDGLTIDNVNEALERLADEGFQYVVIQPLHVICGEEYNEKILEPAREFEKHFTRLQVGTPLLTSIEDYDEAVKAVLQEIPEEKYLKKKSAILFMGHGTHHPANASYSCLQLKMDEMASRVFIGTVEGYPALDDIIPQLKKQKIKEVHLLPYMVVAGDHASNDMSGSEEDSWKSILEKEGFKVTFELKGLGEYSSYQNIYVNHVQNAINDMTL